MYTPRPLAGEGGPQGRERERYQKIADGLSYTFKAKTLQRQRLCFGGIINPAIKYATNDTLVIPAQAGIQFVPSSPKGCKIKWASLRAGVEVLDSRLRGNDGRCLVFCCRVDKKTLNKSSFL
jgi:hypothetical protein